MNTFIRLIMAFILMSLGFWETRVYASDKESFTAATLAYSRLQKDPRIHKLEQYLLKRNTDLIPYADVFVQKADEYSLDWKLVVAIAGLESSFCKRIPGNSFNCWGWGIPTGANDGIRFTSYSNGIEIVSAGLRTRYINKGLLTVEDIGRVYAASPTWASRVRFIMDSIDDYPASSSPLSSNILSLE